MFVLLSLLLLSPFAVALPSIIEEVDYVNEVFFPKLCGNATEITGACNASYIFCTENHVYQIFIATELGMIGTMDNELATSLPELEHLSIYNNWGVHGDLPVLPPNIAHLRVQNTSIGGSADFSQYASLGYLNIANAGPFEGPFLLPPATHIVYAFNASLSASIGLVPPTTTTLDVSDNALKGILNVSEATTLQKLLVQSNQLSNVDFRTYSPMFLRDIDLSSNRFQGALFIDVVHTSFESCVIQVADGSTPSNCWSCSSLQVPSLCLNVGFGNPCENPCYTYSATTTTATAIANENTTTTTSSSSSSPTTTATTTAAGSSVQSSSSASAAASTTPIKLVLIAAVAFTALLILLVALVVVARLVSRRRRRPRGVDAPSSAAPSSLNTAKRASSTGTSTPPIHGGGSRRASARGSRRVSTALGAGHYANLAIVSGYGLLPSGDQRAYNFAPDQ